MQIGAKANCLWLFVFDSITCHVKFEIWPWPSGDPWSEKKAFLFVMFVRTSVFYFSVQLWIKETSSSPYEMMFRHDICQITLISEISSPQCCILRGQMRTITYRYYRKKLFFSGALIICATGIRGRELFSIADIIPIVTILKYSVRYDQYSLSS